MKHSRVRPVLIDKAKVGRDQLWAKERSTWIACVVGILVKELGSRVGAAKVRCLLSLVLIGDLFEEFN